LILIKNNEIYIYMNIFNYYYYCYFCYKLYSFWYIKNQWVKDPQNVTPPILRAEIIKESTNEYKENDYTVIKFIRRRIVSRQNRDKNIIQDVKFIKYDNGGMSLNVYRINQNILTLRKKL